MNYISSLIVGLSFLCYVCGSITTTLSLAEQQRIVKIATDYKKTDLSTVYFAITTLAALGKTPVDTTKLCDVAKSTLDQEDAEFVFQYSEVVKILKCKDVPALSISRLLKDDSNSLTSSHVISAMLNLGQKVDASLIAKFVKNTKDNDSPRSAAAAFYTCSQLSDLEEVKAVVSMVEDINAQADTVNGNKQYDGGLAVTSDVVKGIILLSEKYGVPFMKQTHLIKISKYLLSRKYVTNLKDIYHVVTALAVLSNNKMQMPVAVSVYKTNLLSNDNKVLKVRVTNLLDQSIPDVKVKAKSFNTLDNSVSLFENKQLTKTAGDDNIVYETEIGNAYIAAHSFSIDVMSFKPSRGMYVMRVAFDATKNAKLYVGADTFELNVKVLAKIVVEDVEIAVGEKDRDLTKKSSVAYPNKMASVLEADNHQKLVMTFNLKDLYSKELVTTHQTFVRLAHKDTGTEIFFVAEPDSEDNYKFTLDVGATAKDSFNSLSGKYEMSLIIGDATMQVPINWLIGDITLSFSGEPTKTKRQERVLSPKPIIEHMFRVPEKRPSKIVSTAFTALVLSPLLLMLAMWVKVGVNLSNFSLAPSTLLFHIGLAGIFALYYMFWTQLDMFQTLKYLLIVGSVTFLGGNKMLADMAAARYRS